VVFDNENIYIVNDEIEGLKLTISSLKAQIDEQVKLHTHIYLYIYIQS